MSKIIWLFVCAIYLQFAFCLPTAETQSALKDSSSTEQNALAPAKGKDAPKPLTLEEQNLITRERKRLSAMISAGDRKHQEFILKESNKIAKDILADPAISSIDTVDGKQERAILETYVQDSDDILNDVGKKCIKRVLKDFYTFVNRHNSSKDKPIYAHDIWYKALETHGMNQLEAEEAKLLNEISYQYADEFEKYLKLLSPAGLEKEKDLVYVHETYLENKDVMDKADYGYRYVSFFYGPQAED
ncbi:uncharacterized protein LOC105212059 [Zeugodacus cucurbitae]|uniref:uncharacterized protein LOC105212059 n=1 Tax=Zeugodacus cucurbitae TaxID=28588 RepID=UPI0023D8EFB9|nr:uncharacterized protein LOC105212059 [Zeugodacus cucurbitae]